MDEEKNRFFTIIIVILLLIVSCIGGYCLGKNNVYNNISEEYSPRTISGNIIGDYIEEKRKVKDEKRYMHVFGRLITAEGYDMYAYLYNQKEHMQIVDYKEELYEVTSTGISENCLSDLFSGIAKFDNNIYNCAKSTENDISVGIIYKTGIKTSDISKAFLFNSFGTDGAPFSLYVKSDGTVKFIMNRKGIKTNDDCFNGLKVKDILDYSCAKSSEKGCFEETFKLLLEDDTIKEYNMHVL